MLSINQLAWVANVLVSTVSGGAVGGHRGHHLRDTVTSAVEGTSPSLCSAPALGLPQPGSREQAGGVGPIAGKGHVSLDFQDTFNSFSFWNLCVIHGHLSHSLYAFGGAQVSVTCVLWCKAAFGVLLCPWGALEPLGAALTAGAAVTALPWALPHCRYQQC